MNDFAPTLTRPQALWALAFVPLVWAGLAARARAHAMRARALLGPRAAELGAGAGERDGRGACIGFTLAAALAVVAVAEPRRAADVGHAPEPDAWIVCVDVSASMLAGDVAPSRLERASAEVAALAERLPGARVGLVAFAGAARLLVPPTDDADVLVDLARRVEALAPTRGGSDLGAALDRARAAAGPSTSAVVLLTDGEDSGGRAVEAARACRARGLNVYTLGLGSARGAKIVVTDRAGARFVRDREGREVVTRLDAATLRAVADAGGGEFLDATAGEVGALAALHERRGARAIDPGPERAGAPLFRWPLLGVWMLWTLEWVLRDRRVR